MKRIMYHVTPATDGSKPTGTREKIRRHGLDWSQREFNLWDECVMYEAGLPEYGSEEWPEGNYLWTDLKNARRYAQQWTDCPFVCDGPGIDIWEVDATGLPLKSDPQLRGSFYTEDPIPARRLKLATTVPCRGR